MNKNITLVPVGIVESEPLSWLARRLPEILAQKVIIAEKLPLPSAGYDRRRQQYQGAVLMAMLSKRSIVGAERVVGVIGADCYAPGLNFIFGQARMGGREAIVALPRLYQSFYNQPEDTALFRARLLKEVVHELGHTWGLSHCADPQCVMHFSNTLHDTDVKGVDFCERCQFRLAISKKLAKSDRRQGESRQSDALHQQRL